MTLYPHEVKLFMDEPNTDTTTSQFLNHGQQINVFASKSIKAMNDKYITLAHKIEHLLKFRAHDVLTRLIIYEDLVGLQPFSSSSCRSGF